MSLFKSLFHVTLYTNDIEKTLSFYEKLGICPIFALGEEGQKPWNYYLKVAKGQYLEVQPVHADNPHPIPKDVRYYPDQTVWHFALETDDIETMITELLDKGIELYFDGDKIKRVCGPDEYMRGPDGCKICWVFDPDGTPIELMEQSENSMQHQFDPESYC